MRPLKRDEGALRIGAFSDQRRCQAARSSLSGELVDVPTTILQELVGGAIASHADPDQTHVLEVAEVEERRGIERLADVWGR